MRAEQALILIQLVNLEKCHIPLVAVGWLRWDRVSTEGSVEHAAADMLPSTA